MSVQDKDNFDFEKLEKLIRHIALVREAGILLGKKLIQRNKNTDRAIGQLLIANVHKHDYSKFLGIEWAYLGINEDDKEKLEWAIYHHQRTNEHHPEYWNGIEHMPDLYLAEMSVDIYARSMEQGTDIQIWLKDVATKKYNMTPQSLPYRKIKEFLELLLEKPFKQIRIKKKEGA